MVYDRVRDRVTQKGMYTGIGTFSQTGTAEHGFPPDPQGYGTLSLTKGSITETTCDFPHKNFDKRIKDGEIINSPFLKTTVDLGLSAPQYFEHTYRQNGGVTCSLHSPAQTHNKWYRTAGMWRQNVPVFLTVGSSETALRDSVEELAVTSAFANIDTSEMLALATIAESGKSVESMRAILFRAYKIFKNVRRLNVKGLLKEFKPKELADRYMEARYALRPLYYDALGVANALQKNRGYARRTFRGWAEDSVTRTDTLLNQASGLWGTQTDWRRELTYTVSARAGVLCDISITDLTTFGFDQLAETTWELIPFSFMVDWFVNVGDWVAAHTPNAGVKQRASWVTLRQVTRATRTTLASRSIVDQSGYVKGICDLPTVTDVREESVLERKVDVAASTFPALNIKLDVFKLTDMGIILKNVFK